jgi:hypothetical protein
MAAIVGGGLKAFGIEIPTLQSARRQGLLATFGLILIGAGYVVQEAGKPVPVAREIELFDTKNNDGVLNDPPNPAEFTIAQAHYITFIWNYHWNGGQGVTQEISAFGGATARSMARGKSRRPIPRPRSIGRVNQTPESLPAHIRSSTLNTRGGRGIPRHRVAA